MEVVQTSEIKRPRMICSVITSSENDVLEHLFGNDIFNFQNEIIAD